MSDAPRKKHITRRALLITGGSVLGAAVLAGGGGLGYLKVKVDDYTDPWHKRVTDAGYSLKTAKVGDVGFSYAEGPDNGPALMLLHAQQLDWFSYSRVLPALSEKFHVFDVDYQGHGKTTTPDDYVMSANTIGPDLATFIEQVIGTPAYVTGNSSGGLLTTWLAANRPDLVKAALLEDPPLFASEYPRIKKTVADRDFAASHAAIKQGGVDDFLLFYIDQTKDFFNKNIGYGSSFALKEAVKERRRSHPGEPVELGIIPDDTIRMFLRGMDNGQYDPRFGDAFYVGTWNKRFDHAEALAKIKRPTMLLHANYSWNDEAILNGAMSKADADKAMSYLKTGTYKRIDATHVTNLDKPKDFTRILEHFFLDQNA
jgi:pimeloyl-ACP methyl ester carboxylesterase